MSSTHSQLLSQAKQNQLNDLKQSQIYSKQLINILNYIISINSNENSNLIEKIHTIHQLNNEINAQLNNNVAKSYDNLMQSKKKLEKLISNCKKYVSLIDDMQKKSELIDQNLRILENTLKLLVED
ncbi:unnamed protein product [Candida verbasci]|uniref:Uncharacterized protein n=1 Tax=Candida verbasci TaxID=1227364 RepID=A0A9W4TSI7_9ASCO|nr:unnamed protein product [Candida verbasci]